MARIKGVDIPNDKRVEIALTYIYGIGRNLSKTILKDAKVNPDTKAKDLTEDEVTRMEKLMVACLELEPLPISRYMPDIMNGYLDFYERDPELKWEDEPIEVKLVEL